MTTILGIDPGSRYTGYGLIRVDESRPSASPHYISSGRIRLQAEPMPERLAQLYDSLQSLHADYQPNEVAIEQVFLGKNVASALKLGQARGVSILVSALHGLPLFEYAPRLIKQAVTGNGSADKQQVQSMVVRLLGLDGSPTEDASDALAAALCHAHQRRVRRRLADSAAAKTGKVGKTVQSGTFETL